MSDWKYDIQHGPEGEANYAWLYKGDEMIATMKTHHASALTSLMEENERLKAERDEALDDARFAERIAAKREADAEARVEELERFLFPYAHNKEISGISWDGKYLIGDKASIRAFHSLKNRGEQIDVYKAAYDQNLAAAEARAQAAEQLVKDAVRLLVLYRTKIPLGNQPHMIAAQVDAFIKEAGE
jgi:hypothetical protein